MITLQIKRKDDRACHLNGENEIKSFHNVKELTDYFMSEFSRWYSYNRFYWETSAKKWFSYKKGFCDNDTVYCFGGEFTIKLLATKPKLPVDELEECQKENELNYYGGRA